MTTLITAAKETRFVHLEESFSHKEVQPKTFSIPLKPFTLLLKRLMKHL